MRSPRRVDALVPRPQQDVGVEAGVLTGVAGRADLIDFEQHGVAVAVESHRVHPLSVPRRGALDPLLTAGTGVVGRLPGLQGASQRVVVLDNGGCTIKLGFAGDAQPM